MSIYKLALVEPIKYNKHKDNLGKIVRAKKIILPIIFVATLLLLGLTILIYKQSAPYQGSSFSRNIYCGTFRFIDKSCDLNNNWVAKDGKTLTVEVELPSGWDFAGYRYSVSSSPMKTYITRWSATAAPGKWMPSGLPR